MIRNFNLLFHSNNLYSQAKLHKTKDKGERHKLRSEAKFLRKELREREDHVIRDVLAHADVVLSTNTGATSGGPLKQLASDHFDLIVIDECAQVGLILENKR